VLAFEVTSNVAAFAVVENTEKLVDWGGCSLGKDVSAFLVTVERLVSRYRPDVIVVEEPAGSRKGARARDRLAWIEQWAVDHDRRVRPVEREAYLHFLEREGRTKYEVATRLGRLFPDLGKDLPPPRKTWQREPINLTYFVAVARALWYFDIRRW
ncbi:MAG: hypothetical protein AAFU38_13800, partial [Bacteroidota bacterium]